MIPVVALAEHIVRRFSYTWTDFMPVRLTKSRMSFYLRISVPAFENLEGSCLFSPFPTKSLGRPRCTETGNEIINGLSLSYFYPFMCLLSFAVASNLPHLEHFYLFLFPSIRCFMAFHCVGPRLLKSFGYLSDLLPEPVGCLANP